MGDTKERVLRLAKPIKKGVLRLIFSRFFIFVLLILLQLLFVVMLHLRFTEAAPYAEALQRAFSFAMIIYLFNNKMESSAKLTWLLIISILPIGGALLLAFTQSNIGHRRLKKDVEKNIKETLEAIPQPLDVLEEIRNDGSGTDDLNNYINKTDCFPIYKNTCVKYFGSGEEKFESMLKELEKAESFIFLEYFIIEEGYMWGRILDILARKAKEGVDVRVLYDGTCEISKLPTDYPKRLEELGIKAKDFAPIRPLLSSHYNYRDHRKILVIDGQTAYNGGIKLADEYINRIHPFGHWKDAAVIVKGDAVKSYTLMFLQMWNLGVQEPEYEPYISVGSEVLFNSGGYVMPYSDSPLDDEKVGETVYMDILSRADRYVHIMTPYLILDDELLRSFRFAAMRGIDVRIILPGIPDKKAAYALAKSHYRALISAGVKIYEYTPGFVHAKVFVSDDRKAAVGTINLDYRSLYHHFECATYMYKCECIADIESDFEETLSKCRRILPEDVENESFFYKLEGTVMKLIAPLM